MKNSPLFLIVLFGALALSFGALVLGSLRQFGQLGAYFDAGEGAAFPEIGRASCRERVSVFV